MTRSGGPALFGPALFGLALFGLALASPAWGAVPEKACLPQRAGPLSTLLSTQPTAKKGGARMVTVTRGSPRWMAAFNAILAWENDDCEAFSAFVEKMGYSAVEMRELATGHKSWVVFEDGKPEAPRRYNGLFVLRAPSELPRARRLVISAPLAGSKAAEGSRAAELYEKLHAAALLVSTAERCSLETCSGCGAVPGYACGGCTRASDAAHSVDNLLFALFAALEATRTHNGARPYLHFELTQRLKPPAVPGCGGLAQLSEGSVGLPGTAAQPGDENSYPVRFWRALEKRLGEKCVCYHQRERGCFLEERQSVLGRLVSQESPGPFDPCTQEATRLSGRHLHLEWHNLPVETIVSALAEAVPQ